MPSSNVVAPLRAAWREARRNSVRGRRWNPETMRAFHDALWPGRVAIGAAWRPMRAGEAARGLFGQASAPRDCTAEHEPHRSISAGRPESWRPVQIARGGEGPGPRIAGQANRNPAAPGKPPHSRPSGSRERSAVRGGQADVRRPATARRAPRAGGAVSARRDHDLRGASSIASYRRLARPQPSRGFCSFGNIASPATVGV